MFKRVLLRGISRASSDRAVEDGGVAESINTYIRGGESVPAIIAKDVTGELGASHTLQTVFIHKVGGAVHYLATDAQRKSIFDSDVLIQNNLSASIKEVASVGNTVILSLADNTLFYILWKDGTYHPLGPEIPRPDVRFDCLPQGEVSTRRGWTQFGGVASHQYGYVYELFFKPANFNQYMDASLTDDGEIKTELTGSGPLDFAATFWSVIDLMVRVDNQNSIFSHPVFARAALRLYDGSYIYHTVPVLLGAMMDDAPFSAVVRYSKNGTTDSDRYIQISRAIRYRADYSITGDYSDWKDIVAGVDIFLSENLNYYERGAFITRLDAWDDNADSGAATAIFKAPKETLEEQILGKYNFYRVESKSFDEAHGPSINGRLTPKDQDYLVTQPRLPDDFRSSHNPHPIDSFVVFNNKLIGCGEVETLARGYSHLQSSRNSISQDDPPSSHGTLFEFQYWIRTENGDVHSVIAHNDGFGEAVNPYGPEVFPSAEYFPVGRFEYMIRKSIPAALLFYPDSRCYRVDIRVDQSSIFSLEMKPHPFLDCAYFFGGGLNTPLTSVLVTPGQSWAAETPDIVDRNIILAADINNPFRFPVEGRYRFTAEVNGLASASKALSEGQFGQFPLYVFTGDGIWALATASTGAFVSSSPVSRDVALRGKVVSIDQGVVFISDRGVNAIQGSSISLISSDMNGRPVEQLSDEDIAIVTRVLGPRIVPALSDNIAFMEYMKEAEMVYDYSGRRIIFFRRDKLYQYVFMFPSGSWHKLSNPDIEFAGTLNSYPSALVAMKDKRKLNPFAIFDYSTSLDLSLSPMEEEFNRVKGVILTRGLQLGAPDILKTIDHLKIRGHYARYNASRKPNVSYLLYGSQDGIHYHRLGSLRGKSWKYFRVLILFNLAPSESLTWLDLDFSLRFNTKLR